MSTLFYVEKIKTVKNKAYIETEKKSTTLEKLCNDDNDDDDDDDDDDAVDDGNVYFNIILGNLQVLIVIYFWLTYFNLISIALFPRSIVEQILIIIIIIIVIVIIQYMKGGHVIRLAVISSIVKRA